jgi:hypothetical protein
VKTEDDGEVITAARISKLVHEEVKRVTDGEDKGKWYLAGKLVSTFSSFISARDVKCHNYVSNPKFSSQIRWKIC